MTNFKSRHYPSSRSGVLVVQEYAIQYYGAFNILLMLAVLVQISAGKWSQGLMWMVVVGEVIALALGNMLALAKTRRNYAEVFFLEDHFSLISVHEILFSPKNHAFPLLYANAVMDPDGDRFSVHFNDQIINFYKKDWEEFDLIWGYFNIPR